MVPTDGTIVKFARENVGAYGCIGVSDTTTHNAIAVDQMTAAQMAFTSFLFLSATVFSSLVSSSDARCPNAGVLGLTFPAGSTFYGNVSSFALASGSLIAYLGPRL